jgi:hypothetical protein
MCDCAVSASARVPNRNLISDGNGGGDGLSGSAGRYKVTPSWRENARLELRWAKDREKYGHNCRWGLEDSVWATVKQQKTRDDVGMLLLKSSWTPVTFFLLPFFGFPAARPASAFRPNRDPCN